MKSHDDSIKIISRFKGVADLDSYSKMAGEKNLPISQENLIFIFKYMLDFLIILKQKKLFFG